MKSSRSFYKPSKQSTVSSSEAFTVTIDRLSHDGRGLARHNGKTLFVSGALPGEEVKARYLKQRSKFDEAQCLEVLQPSVLRREPQCRHFYQCGGCELQYLDAQAQIEHKQQQALDQLQRIGSVVPETILPPLIGEPWHYRRRARLSVYCPKKTSEPTLGYRRRQSKQLVAVRECPVLEHKAEQLLGQLSEWLNSASKPQAVSHIELASGDSDAALILRHTLKLADDDLAALEELAVNNQYNLFLQPEGPESLQSVGHEQQRLHYQLPEFDLNLAYHPNDFTQVNSLINQQMVHQAVALLEVTKDDRILDLFCGLGNFTLPLASLAGEVVGIEGSQDMVTRGAENARSNGIDNVEFHRMDLTRDFRRQPWFQGGFSKILLDPPRAGALEVVSHLAEHQAQMILYISCDPATFARDAKELVTQGYRLSHWGVMDMFPQTTHVESIALFQR
ncbi:MAG: 23S rRNA (uracil(1939)-C(5))-methyltransferase RlmD [Motiliproteus sp.]